MQTHPHFLTATNDIEGLSRLLSEVLNCGSRNGVYQEIVGCLLSIDFEPDRWGEFCDIREAYLEVGGEFTRMGWNRATRVYTSPVDKPTKPSYLKRLVSFPDTPRRPAAGENGLNQIEKISIELARKPGFSNLSFVILRPADLHDQFRPGYVPCAIAGDFKFRNGRIDLNVMFRTSDALAVGYADIYYMRQLQMKVLELAQKRTGNMALKKAEIGLLNMYLCRTYIQRTRVNKSGVRLDGLKTARAVIQLLNSHLAPNV